MATRPVVYIVCSDQHRNGKTLLARVLVDYLMLDGHDPFVIDADYPHGPLRNFFPGRTLVVNLETIRGQMALFDTILAAPGRDYVIDLPATQTARFCKAAADLGFFTEARRASFAMVILFIVDKTTGSLASAANVEKMAKLDLLIPVRNAFVGSALPARYDGLTVTMPVLDPECLTLIGGKRFSIREFLLGDESTVPEPLRRKLKSFLYEVMTSFNAIAPALSQAILNA